MTRADDPRSPVRKGGEVHTCLEPMTWQPRHGACVHAGTARRLCPMERVTIFVRGRVQGVGFRWWTRARALELGLAGFARNMDDGRVEICAQGPVEAVEA